jgi:uncharacterized protein
MRVRNIPLALAALASLASCARMGSASASEAHGVQQRPRSYVELKFEATVRQRLDFSCGAAALATISSHYWGKPLRESDVLAIMLSRYSKDEQKKKRDEGFSFDDLVFTARRLGFAAEGAKLALPELAKLAGPVIVHLNKGTFQHFSVLRRAGHGTFYLSDPIVGAIAMPADEFDRQFTGFALAVWRPQEPLPARSQLMAVRDGTSVSLSVGRNLTEPARVSRPLF